MLCRADIAGLAAASAQPRQGGAGRASTTTCRRRERKFLDQVQTKYARKNWSSLMLFNNERCRALTARLRQLRLRPRAAPLRLGRRRAHRRAAAQEWNWLVTEYDLQPGGEARALHAGRAVVRRLPRLRIRRRVVRRARAAGEGEAGDERDAPGLRLGAAGEAIGISAKYLVDARRKSRAAHAPGAAHPAVGAVLRAARRTALDVGAPRRLLVVLPATALREGARLRAEQLFAQCFERNVRAEQRDAASRRARRERSARSRSKSTRRTPAPRTCGRASRARCPMRRLDDFGFDEVDFIKIDVEGFERQVLEGAREHARALPAGRDRRAEGIRQAATAASATRRGRAPAARSAQWCCAQVVQGPRSWAGRTRPRCGNCDGGETMRVVWVSFAPLEKSAGRDSLQERRLRRATACTIPAQALEAGDSRAASRSSAPGRSWQHRCSSASRAPGAVVFGKLLAPPADYERVAQ